jgi:hypothetical protein
MLFTRRTVQESPTPKSRRFLMVPTGQQISYLIDEDSLPTANTSSEHVLKPSASNPGLSFTGENTRPPPQNANHITRGLTMPMKSNPFLTNAAKRPSPTPSLKRHKAEKLLKEHGSPPNVRVTAGGRIVPSDFTPLGSPCMPFASIQRPKIPGPIQVPNNNLYVPNQSGATAVNGAVSYLPDGRAVQYIDGKWLPVPSDPRGGLALFMPPSTWSFPPLGAPLSVLYPMGMVPSNMATVSSTNGLNN